MGRNGIITLVVLLVAALAAAALIGQLHRADSSPAAAGVLGNGPDAVIQAGK